MVVGDVSAQTVRTMEAVVEDDAVQTDPVMQRRLASATTLDRNQYTVVGRALQKHSHRRHSHFSAPPGGERAADYNREGATATDGDPQPPKRDEERDHPGLGPTVDIFHQDGRGARFHRDTHAFIGLLERSGRTS